jgi:hypothetical protein
MSTARTSTEGLVNAESIDVASPLLPLQEYESTYVRIAFGAANDKDFVLHIEPKHAAATFPKLADAYKIMHKHLAQKFPTSTQVEIVPPQRDWAVQYVVLVAKGAMEQWSFDEKEIEATLPDLAAELDSVIHAARERRRLRQ